MVVSVMVETVVLTELSELRSAEAGRAEANTRAAPAAMVPQPTATLRRDARGGVGAVLMMPPASGDSWPVGLPWPEAGCQVDRRIRADIGGQRKRLTHNFSNYDRGESGTHEW